jgi:D-tyrosyl-tRNA(Tyr) deacylase
VNLLPLTALFLLSSMRVLLQRVSQASVTIGGRVVGAIGGGFLLLVGFSHGDTIDAVRWMTDKVAGLRVFNDDDGKMNRDLAAVGGAVLVVSQFTLYGDATKGRRPSFIDAARPEIAIPLYEAFLASLAGAGLTVASGEFGADMQVSLINDGPVTLMLEHPA